jgi:hypothetical protein
VGLGHTYVNDELGVIASGVVARIAPNRADRETKEDCWQTAYATGLDALRTARAAGSPTSTTILMLAMQTSVFRLLYHRSRRILREADIIHVQ